VDVRNVAANHLGYFALAVCEGLPRHHTKFTWDGPAAKLNVVLCQCSAKNYPLSVFLLPSSINWWQWWCSRSFWALASCCWIVSSHSCTACLTFSDGRHIQPPESFFLGTQVSGDQWCGSTRLTSMVLFVSIVIESMA